MTDKRATSNVSEMVDTLDNPPRIGQNILAISKGGKLCEVVWQAGLEATYVCWSPYPKIPAASRQRMLALYNAP